MFQRTITVILGALILILTPFRTDAFQNTPQPAAATTSARPPLTPQLLAIQQASKEDHQQRLDQLHIAALRPGVNARVVGSTNYDEAKANPYPDLPGALKLKSGKKVTSAKMWWDQRRPEIAEDFDREVYGRFPNWELTNTINEKVGEIPIVTRILAGHADNSSYPEITVDIQLSLSTPANAKTPMPVIMAFGGGFPGAARTAPPAISPAQQGAEPGPSWQAGLRTGIIGLINKGQPRKPEDWGALKAWAWGADRAMDYFETDKAVDAKRVAIQGHSRYGKAAVVTMAYVPRLAIVFVSSSGEGGARLHRRNFGEIVENVAGQSEYHWMGGNFLKYAGPLKWSDLPVDSHELIAMCAPRPVFLSAGNLVDPAVDIGCSNAWADAQGTFMAGVAAGPVYRLLGKKDLGTTAFPPINTGIMTGDLTFRQHSAGHTPNPNWPHFLAFAEREFKEGR